ncbi:MAG: hypothetical protein EBR28_11145 [Planctomycetia bacterium]|nr:hypothetical protein [Planctomycetia bacterium]
MTFPMPPFARLVVTLGICLGAGAISAQGDDAPQSAAPRDVAADGTVSVVVNPPDQSPPAAMADGPAPAVSAAATVMAGMLEPAEPAAERLHERPLPLLEALERSGDRSRRLWITQAYWKAVTAFADLRQAGRAVGRLELVAPGASEHDRAVVEALVADARAERAERQAALVVAQQELVDLVRLPPGEPLPWPVDRPLVTAYQTHFDTIFANRAATGRVRAINRTLPVRQQGIEARAAAVQAAEQALEFAEAEHAKGRLPIEAVAAATGRLGVQERRFIEDVRVYNGEIAEYVMAVADFSVPDDRFASMLIGTPIPWRSQGSLMTVGATAETAPPSASPPSGPPPVFVPPAGLQAAPPPLPATP